MISHSFIYNENYIYIYPHNHWYFVNVHDLFFTEATQCETKEHFVLAILSRECLYLLKLSKSLVHVNTLYFNFTCTFRARMASISSFNTILSTVYFCDFHFTLVLNQHFGVISNSFHNILGTSWNFIVFWKYSL